MKIVTERDLLLKPLLRVGGIVERRQTLPILANILINVGEKGLRITATDLEIELNTLAPAQAEEEADITLPARKLVDICKALPEGSAIEVEVKGDRAILRSGRSRFTLGLLPAADLPRGARIRVSQAKRSGEPAGS